MSSAIIIPLLICVSVFFIALFSGAEMALTSVDRVKVKNRAENRQGKAARLDEFLENPNRFLNTTLVGTNLALVTGSSLTAYFFDRIVRFQLPEFVVDILIFTPMVLIFGEIIPKTIFREYNYTLAENIRPLIRLFEIIFTPFNILLNTLMKMIFGESYSRNSMSEMLLSRSGLMKLLDRINRKGLLQSEHLKLLRRWLQFNKSTVGEIMIPRTEIVAVEWDVTLEELKEVFIRSGWERIPVFDGDIDSIIGFVLWKDLLKHGLKGKNEINVTKMLRRVIYVPESKFCQSLLNEMIKDRIQMAVIVDEHGGTAGIVTIKHLLNEFTSFVTMNETGKKPLAKKVAKNVFVFDSKIDACDVEDLLGIKFDKGDYVSLAGCILNKLGRIPEKGEHIELGGADVVVLTGDEKKIGYVRMEL